MPTSCPIFPARLSIPSVTIRRYGSIGSQLEAPPNLANILDGNFGIGSRRRGQSLIILLDIDDGSIRSADGRITAGGANIRESDSAKIGERNERQERGEVLHDPLRIRLAKSVVILASERMGNSLASGQILHDGSSCGLARRVDSDLDFIASRDTDTAEVVGIVREPFIPGVRGGATAIDTEIHTGLQDGGLARVPVDANPGCGTILLVTVGSRRSGWGWHGESTGHGRVARIR